MDNKLFRKKSLERISSPEELHDYMRVTGPRLWMLLATIVALLAGFIAYAATARLENVMRIEVELTGFDSTLREQADDGGEGGPTVRCALPMSDLERVRTGMKLRLGEETGSLSRIRTDGDAGDITLFFEMEHDDIPLPDGRYPAELVLDDRTPISFLWE